MFQLGKKIEAFAEKAPAAVLQYEKKLLFSTVMMIMIDVILKSANSVNRAFQLHREKVPVTVKALYNKINNIETAVPANSSSTGFAIFRSSPTRAGSHRSCPVFVLLFSTATVPTHPATLATIRDR